MNTIKKNSSLKLLSALVLISAVTGCFDYGAGSGGGGGGGGGGSVKITKKLNPSADDPTYVISGYGVYIQHWVDGSSLRESSYKTTDGKQTTRVMFDTSTGDPTAIHEEKTGTYVVVAEPTPSRVEFHQYDKTGAWTGAFAIYSDKGSFKMGKVTGIPAFSGQLQGQLASNGSGGTGSFAVVTDPASTLTDIKDVTKSVQAFQAALTGAVGTNQGPLQIKRSGLVSLSKALKVAGTVLAVAGAAAVLPEAYAAAGVCMIVGGYFTNDIANFVEKNFASEDPFAQSMVDVVVNHLRDPKSHGIIETANNVVTAVENVFTTGHSTGSANPSASFNTSQNYSPAPTPSSPSTNLPPSTLASPPAVAANVAGQAVWQDNTTYQVTGTANPDGTVSLTGSNSSGGTLTVTGSVSNSSANGTYTKNGDQGSMNGSVAQLGQCQTSTGSGGQGTFTNVHYVGDGVGQVSFTYDAYSIPDAFTVTAAGNTLFTTGGLVSNGTTVQLNINGEGNVFVSVSAPQSGTAWQYSVGCLP